MGRAVIARHAACLVAGCGRVTATGHCVPALAGRPRRHDRGTWAGDSPDARIALYNTSVLIARDRFPFGVGLGRYGSGTSRDPYSPVYHEYGLDKIDGLSPQHSAFISDTFWPRILGETGVIGLAALLVFTVVLTIQVWRAALIRHTICSYARFCSARGWSLSSHWSRPWRARCSIPRRGSICFLDTVAVALAVARNSKTPELAAGAAPSPAERSGVQP